MPERKTLNEDLFYKGSSANLPRLHTCENKTPFWDKSKVFASQYQKNFCVRIVYKSLCAHARVCVDYICLLLCVAVYVIVSVCVCVCVDDT